MRILMGVLLLVLFYGCPSRPTEETLIKIDNYSMSSEDFVNELNSLSDFERAGKTKEELLDEIIQKKLLLLEAQRQGLDKDATFMKMVEHFWEQSLLRAITEKKIKEFSKTPPMSKDERERISKEFEEWLVGLKKKAKIYINKKALETLQIPVKK